MTQPTSKLFDDLPTASEIRTRLREVQAESRQLKVLLRTAEKIERESAKQHEVVS